MNNTTTVSKKTLVKNSYMGYSAVAKVDEMTHPYALTMAYTRRAARHAAINAELTLGGAKGVYAMQRSLASLVTRLAKKILVDDTISITLRGGDASEYDVAHGYCPRHSAESNIAVGMWLIRGRQIVAEINIRAAMTDTVSITLKAHGKTTDLHTRMHVGMILRRINVAMNEVA